MKQRRNYNRNKENILKDNDTKIMQMKILHIKICRMPLKLYFAEICNLKCIYYKGEKAKHQQPKYIHCKTLKREKKIECK